LIFGLPKEIKGLFSEGYKKNTVRGNHVISHRLAAHTTPLPDLMPSSNVDIGLVILLASSVVAGCGGNEIWSSNQNPDLFDGDCSLRIPTIQLA